MYTIHKNVQILIALLKEHGIRHIVCSAGTRNIPFVFSVLRDDFFKCYSIVDERSAGFFAIGIMQVTQEPCAIVCTSGTASCNYLSAVTEAYYQHLPLVVLTSDRLRAHLNQQEDQCIPQLNLYHDVIRKVVDLAPVRDDMDAWYCGRLVNEALLELDHREKGPVQINFQVDPKYPTPGGDFIINQPSLPKVTKISRIMADDGDDAWMALSKRMEGKKIVIFYGQNLPISQHETDVINDFCDKYDVIFYVEHISNIHIKNRICSAGLHSKVDWKKYTPDIVITMGGNRMADPKFSIRAINDSIEHWHVSPNGEIADLFKCQNLIVECKQSFFFQKLAGLGKKCQHPYLDLWRSMEKMKIVRQPLSSDFEFSQVYAIKRLCENLPENSILHISNSNSIRIISSFDLPSGIDVYCNRGTCGIDGSMSAYVANSYMSDRPSFLCIGDLSFFYDMNALWNNYINANTRILLCNNSGGAILNLDTYKSVCIDNAPVNTPAIHSTSAKGWAESRGFKYLCAHNKEEYEDYIKDFVMDKSDKPILFEMFSDMDLDIKMRSKISSLYGSNMEQTMDSIKGVIPKSVKTKIKKLLK